MQHRRNVDYIVLQRSRVYDTLSVLRIQLMLHIPSLLTALTFSFSILVNTLYVFGLRAAELKDS